MTTDEGIMSEMIERAVSGDSPDELSVQMFCLIIRNNPNLVAKAQEMIISKIRSSDVAESTRLMAIGLLEECMSKCGTDFLDEASKFRFLNELIRLVSKKYKGDKTPTSIKKRILECLLLWTTEFPQKAKIREAYDMLNKEGSIEHGNSAGLTAITARRENVLGIDEEKLSQLIKSNDPENLKRANLLIKHQVKQDNRRLELIMQHKSTLNEVQTTANLLSQMLDTCEKDGVGLVADGSETMNLIRELYNACKKHKPIMQRLPDLIQNIDAELLAETLKTNDILQAVMKRYKDAKPTRTPTGQTDLLSEFLGNTESNITSPTTPTSTPNAQQVPTILNAGTINLDDLKEIFGNNENENEPEPENMKYSNTLFSDSADILQPVNVFRNVEDKTSTECQNTPEKSSLRELREIDKISDDLFKQNMQTKERSVCFKKREPEKITLNDLLKEKLQPKTEEVKKEIVVEKTKETFTAFNMEDDEILSDNIDLKAGEESKLKTDEVHKSIKANSDNQQEYSAKPQLHLSEIEIDLDELKPCFGNERILLDDEDIKITMIFTEDRPSKQVSVIVLAVSNKSKEILNNFQFEASVKKPCKVRLLQATDNTLPPFKPFRPPASINQVLLLSNPTAKDVDVTCIFGYTLGDDPDPVKESIVVKGISYME